MDGSHLCGALAVSVGTSGADGAKPFEDATAFDNACTNRGACAAHDHPTRTGAPSPRGEYHRMQRTRTIAPPIPLPQELGRQRGTGKGL